MSAKTTGSGYVVGEEALHGGDDDLVTARVVGELAASRALGRLEALGVSRDDVEILSALPIPDEMLGGPMRSTRIPFFTATGALIGLGLGVFFSLGTLWLYPLEVGGQENVAPPILIIMYELTMLGIVVATVFGFVWETRIRVRSRPHWRDVSRDGFYLSVEVPPDLVASRVRGALEEVGAELVPPDEMIPGGAPPEGSHGR